MGMGCMAVFAVSGSVALVAHQAHKRLLSDFMNKIEFEFGLEKCRSSKMKKNKNKNNEVRFEQKTSSVGKGISSQENYDLGRKEKCKRRIEGTIMPLNRLVLYKGILEYRNMLFLKK
ncbi:hypothetical protein Dimus_007397 [Dionaea muscipula]